MDAKQGLQPTSLTFRALESGDENLLFLWENDRSLWPEGVTVQPWSKEVLKQYVSGIQDIYTDRQLRLVLESMGNPVGLLDLFDFDPKHRRAGVGVLIADPDLRGKGLGKAALQLLETYARESLFMRLLHADIAASNTASLALFEACGFEKTGVKPGWLLTQSGPVDVYHYQKMFG